MYISPKFICQIGGPAIKLLAPVLAAPLLIGCGDDDSPLASNPDDEHHPAGNCHLKKLLRFCLIVEI